MAFAIALLVGPGEIEIGRTRDLFDSILHHESRRVAEAHVYLVNDGNPNVGALEEMGRAFGRFFHLRNPLAGTRSDPYAKMTAGMIHAISEAAKRGPYDFVLKLDTDALVINPFYDGLVGFFEANPGAGVAGSYLSFPNGVKRKGKRYWERLLHRSADPEYAWSTPRILAQFPLSLLRVRRRRDLLISARQKGYQDGFHVLGGSYAVAGRVLAPWRQNSVEKHTLLYRDTEISEDVVVSLLVKWLGFELADFNQAGEVFGVWFRELQLPHEVLAEQYSIIHSVKSGKGQVEEEVRSFFRERRHGGTLVQGHKA